MAIRPDDVGLFWRDLAPVKKPKKEVIKRTPPDRFWERPDYLPGLDEAVRFAVSIMSTEQLIAASDAGDLFNYDVECYANYFLVMFRHELSGRVYYVESHDGMVIDRNSLMWCMTNLRLYGFNNNHYDHVVVEAAIAGLTTYDLKKISDDIILYNARAQDIRRQWGFEKVVTNEFDLFELKPKDTSLKTCAARLHCKKAQDLPVPPDVVLSPEQKAITRLYCANDTANTSLLYTRLKDEINLREVLGAEYGLDLRSKSDAQIAEAVISNEISSITGKWIRRPSVNIGEIHKFKRPHFIEFQTPMMQALLQEIVDTDFIVSDTGKIDLPPQLKTKLININKSSYQMGIGGLHSTEKSQAIVAKDGYVLRDRDVESFYPRIILNQGLAPAHLGAAFLQSYRRIVDRRVAAKRSGNKLVAGTLKIVINGSFGKFGSQYSNLYSPSLVIQTTLTGQLSLLMLIETLELYGIEIVSANTDGIVMYYHESNEDLVLSIIKNWENKTCFVTEETRYTALYSRDVNNYIAIKPNGDIKKKGVLGDASLTKTPSGEICSKAVVKYLVNGTPIADTVRGATDVTDFIHVRKVKGGGVKLADGDMAATYLGKTVRWYYGVNSTGEIISAYSGNKVASSDGAMPMMTLSDELPADIDYEKYISDAYNLLEAVGVSVPDTHQYA